MFVDGKFLFGADAECLIQFVAQLQDVSDPALGNGPQVHVTYTLEHRQLFFGADAQRFVQFAAQLQDVGDLAFGDGCGVRVLQAFEHRQLFFGVDAQCLVQVAAQLQDVGDLTLGDGQQAHISQTFEHRQLFFGTDAQRLVQFAASLPDIGDPAPGDGQRPYVSQTFVDGNFLVSADAQRLVQCAAILQEVGDSTPSDGSTPAVVHAFQSRQGTRVGALRLLRLADGSLQVTELKQQVDVHRSQWRACPEKSLQLIQTISARGFIRRRKIDPRRQRIDTIGGCRQREVEHPGTPRPEIRGAGRHRSHVAVPNPRQHGTPATRGQRFPAIVQPLQQVIQTIRPPFQAAELYRTVVRLVAQAFKQLFGADPSIAIYGHAQPRPQQFSQKGSRDVAIGAIGIGKEAEGKRPPVRYQPAKPQQRAGMFRTERPCGTDFIHR